MGFMVTNLTGPIRAVVRFDNKRGTAEVGWSVEAPSSENSTKPCIRRRSGISYQSPGK